MRKKFLKKVLTLVIAGAMSVSLLAACGNKAEETEESSAGVQSSQAQNVETHSAEAVQSSEASAEESFEHDAVLNELGVEPYVNQEVTITIGLQQNANIENYDTNYLTTLLEEISGVNIEFELFTAGGEANQKLQMMVAGSEELPDIILWSQNDALMQQWGKEGYILPLEEYFEHSSIYAKEGYARVKEASGYDILASSTSSDGHIWQFPNYVESTTNPQYDRTWVYGPWLEALNLELPKTTEEFRAMLEAFKTQDPNGNEKADEIPMIGCEISTQGGGAVFWEYLMNAFVHSSCKKNFLISTDGQLSVSFTTEEWKEGVKYLHGLVQDGLLDPISFTQDQATFKQLLNSSGDQIVGCFQYVSPSFIAADHPSKQQWILLEPLTGPEGVCSTGYNADLASGAAFISADCEHPEVAFRLLDLMCREDITITKRWGKQGENWDYVADIKDNPAFKDVDFGNNWMGYPAYFYEYKNIWNQTNNTHWMNAGPSFRTAEVAAGWYASSLVPENTANWELSLKLDAYEAVKPKEVITAITYETTELQTESEELYNEIKQYVYEKLAGWCVGTSDVESDWDAYLKELEALQLSRWLEIQQAGWN